MSDPLCDREVRRPAVLRHVEEVTGNVAMTPGILGSAASCTTSGCAATALRAWRGAGISFPAAQELSACHRHRGRRQDHPSAG